MHLFAIDMTCSVLISPGSLYQSECSQGSKLTARLVSHFSLSTLFLIICLQSKYKHIRPFQQRIKSYVFRKEPTTPFHQTIQHTQLCHTNSCAQRTDTVFHQYYQCSICFGFECQRTLGHIYNRTLKL